MVWCVGDELYIRSEDQIVSHGIQQQQQQQ